jgi:nicotinamide-nucleotide amidase
MPAALLSIGTELTRGELVNTNASWLADRLTTLGFDVDAIETIPDDRATIVETLRRLATRHRVVVVTGGLGPTTDDLTSACAAEAAGVPLERHEPSLEAIRRRFASLGREMGPSNAKQADFPRGSEVLPNPIGTAPGFSVQLGGSSLFFTPGVPVEMRRMFEEQIAPRIAPLAPNDAAQNHLKTFGAGESKIGEMLEGVEQQFPGVTIGYRAHFPEIEVKLFARGRTRSEAQVLADAATREARQRLGDLVYGEGREETFPATVARVLRKGRLTLSIAESCTGGLVGSMLTALPGSSEFLLFDGVVYSNAAKTAVLGVDEELIRAHGAVSPECVTAMVEGVRRLTGSDLAVAITGIAGPTGGTDRKPVGLVYVAVADPHETIVKEKHFAGDRHRVQTFAAWYALKLVLDQARALVDTSAPPPVSIAP